MDLLGIPRSKISYLNRLKQDLSIAIQLKLDADIVRIENMIIAYKDRQREGRKARSNKLKDITNEQ